MSSWRQQALIEASVEDVWELVGDPNRHPEWWPTVLRGRGAADGRAGCHIPPGQPHPEGKIETTFQIEELDEMREIKLTCQDYGTYARWLLTETQDATFADIELGFESDRTSLGVLRAPLAKRFLRRWLEMSLVGLHRATGGES